MQIFFEFIQIFEPVLSLGSSIHILFSSLKQRFNILIIYSSFSKEIFVFFIFTINEYFNQNFCHENKLL